MRGAEPEAGDRWQIRLLNRTHRREDFACGVEALDTFLRRYARQNAARGLGHTYVASPCEDERFVAGYYTIAVGSVSCEELPTTLGQGLPNFPLPVVLLGRLAVDRGFQGQGLGEALLLDAFDKALLISQVAGALAVQVHAKDERAASFYARYGFKAMQDAPHTMFLSMKVLRRSLL